MFEKQPISPSSLLTQLVAGVKERVKSPYSRGENTIWTLSVKETLKAIGKAPPLNFECIYTDRQAGTSEFVLDLVWWDRDSGEGAALALECEWFYERISRGEAQYAEFVSNDFWKLLVFKSPLKLLIFASVDDYPTMQATVLAKLRECLRLYKHHVAGETYLFLDFAPVVRAWITKITQSGMNADLDLTPRDIEG